ncbi:MAG: Haloacid dehalogenase-like hydrolase [Thermoanaerobacterales bacterium 50_218]|nr:MAG: Haloacid dehalogenase-like hydrolase [Thermoanaerobacterales bacterium 50_218]HAA90075.1 HAD family hydrolase [Peptococcaceae bacterium]
MVFKAFLFDLDGTLVPMDMKTFIDGYFRAVSEKFAHIIEPEKLVSAINAGTMAMLKNTDPRKTNKDVFWEHFFSHIDHSREVFVSMFDEFYQKDFANLKTYTHPNPLARPLMEFLFEKGNQVVIATNPVFPETAVRERLKWVDIGDFPYHLVTTYENMHYCKPRIEYYREVLDFLGVDPQDCLMVGNDVEEDLVARDLGMKTFLVEDWLLNRSNLPIVTDYRGSFEDLVSFLKDATSSKKFCHPVR